MSLSWDCLKSEKNLIILSTIIGLVIGLIYAHDRVCFSKEWFADILSSLTVTYIIFGVYMRYLVADSREKTGKTTKNIESVLTDTSEKMIRNFRQITYDAEIRHYRTMLGANRTQLPNIWHYKLRFESEDRLHIEVHDGTPGATRTDNCIIRVRGFTEENHGGFMNRYYLAEVERVLGSSDPTSPIFTVGQVVACCWLNSSQKISLSVTDMPGGPAPVFDFTITGVPGHVTFLGTPPMASAVTPTPRLIDEIRGRS